MLDLIITNGRIVTAAEILPAGLELGVKDGKISVIGRDLDRGSSTDIVDAEGAYITPGGVDSHAHIEQDNSPTGDTWETGTRSAIAGGNTTIIAFATQKRQEESMWPALTAYHKKATGNAFCDYGIHMILTNPTEELLATEMPQLIEKEGISSIKLYMTYQPLKLDDADLFNIMMRTRSLGITTMIHAENNDIIEQITKRLVEQGHTGTYFHSVARPQIAESEATFRAISLAEVTDAPILIVHMSAPAAVEHVSKAQRRLLPIHAETCPQYLYLTSTKLQSSPEDFEGSKHICAPPLRHDTADLEFLWQGLANGTFTVVSSDHAPSTFNHPDGKKRGLLINQVNGDGCAHNHGPHDADFRHVPNGLPGIETRLPLIFDRTFDPAAVPMHEPGEEDKVRISLPRFVQLTSTNPAKLYGLADRKGSLQPGFDADIVIWYPEGPLAAETANSTGAGAQVSNGSVPALGAIVEPKKFVITNNILHHRIDYTPFEGVVVRNWPRKVFLRGKLAWDRDGAGVVGAKGSGEFLRRQRSNILTGQMGRKVRGMSEGEWGYWM